MRRPAAFAQTIRRGARARRGDLMVYVTTLPQTTELDVAATVGFVVGKAVGNAVTRHRVTRRLRHCARSLVTALPPGAQLVVRALPDVARRPSHQLCADLTGAVTVALGRARQERS